VAITLEAVHAVEALQEAYDRFSRPNIVNTDQGSQFTAQEFVDAAPGEITSSSNGSIFEPTTA
jgi:putative transposase